MALEEITGRRLGRRERFLAVIAGVVIVGALLYVGAVEPALMRWRELSTRLDGQKLALKRSERLSASAEDIEREFMLSFDLSNSVEEAVNSLMEEVRAQAGTAVRISGIRPTSPSLERGFQIAKAQIEFEGTFSKAASFVYQIEKRSGGVWLERCQLAPVGRGSSLLRGTAIVCRAVARRHGETTS